MDKAQLKLLARVVALEYVVGQILYMIASEKADPLGELRGYASRLKAELSEATIPTVDPAMSDVLTQELSEAVDALLDGLLRKLEREQG